MNDLVKNAADPRQVRNAGRKERDRRSQEIADLQAVLRLPEARRVLWRLLEWSEYLRNPTHARGDMTHQNIGRADAGRFLLSEIVEADEDKLYLMMQEARARKRYDAREAEAIRTPSAFETTEADSEKATRE
mgnify:CR=1 FL=1